MRVFIYLWIVVSLCTLPLQAGISQKAKGRIDSLILHVHSLRHQPAESLKAARFLWQESQKLNYPKGVGAAYMRMGSIYLDWGQLDSARWYMLRCWNIREKLRDETGANSAATQLSRIHSALGNLDSAYYYLYRILARAEANADEAGRASVFHHLGNLSLQYKDTDTAFYYFSRARDIARTVNTEALRTQSAMDLGNYYVYIQQYQKALRQYQQADSILSLHNDPINYLKNLNNLAVCYEGIGAWSQALKHYRLAAGYYDEFGLKSEAAITFSNLGVLYYNRENWDSAQFYFQRSLHLSRLSGQRELQAQNLKNLSDTYALSGRYREALQYHYRYKSLNDSLIDDQKIATIAEMQTRFDTEAKSRQIKLLNSVSENRTLQRNLALIVAIMLTIGLLISVMVFIQRQRLSRREKELALLRVDQLINEQEIKSYSALLSGQEEERQRVSRDLHDRLGSMLSTLKLLLHSGLSREEKVLEIVDEACLEVRRISHNLSNSKLYALGLKASIEELFKGISHLLSCRLEWRGAGNIGNRQLELEIYRIIQEIVNNTLKHARAKNFVAQICIEEAHLVLITEDDGKGFSGSRLKEGIGLQNMKERARLIGGSLHIDSGINRGFIHILEIPLKKPADD